MNTDTSFPIYEPSSSDVNDRILLIDKPAGISSFDVIRRLRKSTGIRKIGHAGTLDPIATGLLICMTGRATKASRMIMDGSKVYTGVIKIGEETPSFDSETEVIAKRPTDQVTDEQIFDSARKLTGQQIQLTPNYAAVKIGGKPLYKYAREGKSVTRPPRIVDVAAFDILGREGDLISFSIACSTGTYIRTLAHDLGALLGVGAHLVVLRRTKIGEHSVEDAVSPDHFDSLEVDS